MKKKVLGSLALCLLMFIVSGLVSFDQNQAWGAIAAGKATVSASPSTAAPGGTITISYSGAPGNARDWIGIYKTSANDRTWIGWKYLEGNRAGTLTFNAPGDTGSYNFRMFENDGYTLLATSNAVTVSAGTVTPPVSGGTASLRLDKTSFTPGEQIAVYFTAPASYPGDAWVGIIPSNVPHGDEAVNDGYDLTYQYVNKRTSGTMTFSAPSQAGAYDFRLHDTDGGGKEVASVSFTVSAGTTGGGSGANLRATPGDGYIYLEWNASASALGYNLFRGTSSGGETSTPVTDFPITGTSHTDLNVKNGTNYCYIMRPVYSGEVMGGSSNEACATPRPGGGTNTGGGTTGSTAVEIILQINNPYMTVNSQSREIDPGRGTVPVIVSGRTLLPIRSVIEAVGGSVGWNGSERKVTIQTSTGTIELWIDNEKTRVNGITQTTDVAPRIINDRTMLPLRFIAENLGFNVEWDGQTYTVTMNYNP